LLLTSSAARARDAVVRRAGLRLLRIVFALFSAGLHAQASGPAVLPAFSPNDLETVVVESTRLGGPAVSPTGANDYAVTSQDIVDMPGGENSQLTEVLTHMPGVALDQNQQIHIRNTEGPQFQYQINGVMIPFDINTNPPFLSMINPLFIKQVDLLDGILPSRYSYATGGVVDIKTKDGCDQSGGDVGVLAGQRSTLQPSVQYAACDGELSSYFSGEYLQSNTAFSSATPGPDAIHDRTQQGQVFGFFSYPLASDMRLSLILSAASSTNQLPNLPNLAPEYALTGVTVPPSSAAINSYLDFQDVLAVLSISGATAGGLSYQLAYTEHAISQRFKPDAPGELIYQGVASTASHDDHDHTLEGDLNYTLGAHVLSTGLYAGIYSVSVNDSSLVFPADADGNQLSDLPQRVINNDQANNVVSGIYVNDLWQVTPRLRTNIGLRRDQLTGFTRGQQLSPTFNLAYTAAPGTTIHGGFARYFQVPSFLGISPSAPASFNGTTAAGPAGVSTPVPEDDYEWDLGVVHQVTENFSVSIDNFYERTRHYLDTGQFGVVPIFAPFNYSLGYIWGSELAAKYRNGGFSTYANLTLGRNWQQGVVTGQFNFAADELAYIDGHAIVLDHQPLYGASAGLNYQWHRYAASLDAIYSSGLRAGFADLERLPEVVQVNLSLERSFQFPRHRLLTNRITVLNIFDRVNLIRPAEGIGIFQSAYGPRATVFGSLSLHF
jgi:outer membrane cobalamin receptor